MKPNQPSSIEPVLLSEPAPLFPHLDEYDRPAEARLRGAELSIIVPTFNERENVTELVRRLDSCLKQCAWEVIFVDDDSPDATASVVREAAQRDVRVRCVQRLGRRGLSSACVEGMLASAAPYLAVIDGDLQHDEALLPSMLEVLKKEDLDVVVGSRYVSGGGVVDWKRSRAVMSRMATWISRLVVRAELTDPMSGFFMIRREAFATTVRNLSAIGFKILLDFFASSPRALRFKELPYQFRPRRAGNSKLDNQAICEYGMLLLDKLVGRLFPVRFIAFTLVGGFGILVHLATLTLLFGIFQIAFVASQIVATLVAMTSNFALNNVLTYRDMQLRGWQWLRGWIAFVLVCSIGALANVGISVQLFEQNSRWLLDAMAGVAVGTVWNYSMSMIYTWKSHRGQRSGL